MPYIITTTPAARLRGTVTGFSDPARATRTAIATLDEARKASARLVDDAHTATGQSYNRQWEGWAATDLYVDESGGTVGPLPDGTVIEVVRVEWDALAESAGIDAHRRRYITAPAYAHGYADEILAAFNAQQ